MCQQEVFLFTQFLLELFQNFMLNIFVDGRKHSRCHSWGSALMPSPLATPPRIIGNREATRSCSVSSQTDVQSFFDGPIEIRVGRSEDDVFFRLCRPFDVLITFCFVESHSKCILVETWIVLHMFFMSPFIPFVLPPCTFILSVDNETLKTSADD